jgi:peptidoglycan/LPS O-acetylase OafA/YrhL
MGIKYRYLPTLDGWRAIAIAMVVLSHARSPLFNRPGLVHDIAPRGRMGVDVFFAISGLLICGRLLDEAEQADIDIPAFYVRRAFRILPPYLLYLGVLAVLNLGGAIRVSAVDFLACLAFVRNYFMTSPSFSLYTNHFWSLAVEEHFYLLWPSALKWLRARRAVIVAIAVCLAVNGWRAALARSPHLSAPFFSTGILWRTDTRIDALLWGCVGALLMRPLTPLFSRYALTTPILVFLFVASWKHLPMQPLDYAVGFTALVLSTTLHPNSVTGRILELAPVRWIGRLSYSLYIWQTIFFEEASPSGRLGLFQRPPMNAIALLVCAVTSYYAIEKPFIAIGRRLAASTFPRRSAGSLAVELPPD